ncbi:TIGR02679 domain-containing protein [Bacillus sp. N9]
MAGLTGQTEKDRISLSVFEKELQKTIFAPYSFIQLMEDVLQETILTKEEEAQLAHNDEKSFIQSLLDECPAGGWWWEWIEKKFVDSRWIWSLYSQDPQGLFTKLVTVFKAFQQLPDEGNLKGSRFLHKGRQEIHIILIKPK